MLLLGVAEERARAAAAQALSVIVAGANERASSLYRRCGFAPAATEPVAIYPGAPHEGDWVLMLKTLC